MKLDPAGLPQRLALARDYAGLKQEELGKKLGFAKQTVSKWEASESAGRQWSLETLQHVANVTGVSLYWLLTGLGDMVDAQGLRPAGHRLTHTRVRKMPLPDLRKPEKSKSDEFVIILSDEEPANLLAFEVTDLANHPEIKIGNTVVVHTGIPPEPGDFCAVHKLDTDEIIFRRVSFRGRDDENHPLLELTALNPDYASEIVAIGKDALVRGVMIHEANDTRGSRRIIQIHRNGPTGQK